MPGRRDLPRAGGERRHRAGRAALRQGLPDPQDALHLLRLLRRGVPRVGNLHGQGLRARGVQEQGLHLGQAGSAGASGNEQTVALRRFAWRFGALGAIHGDFASVRRIRARHPEVPFWISVGDLADDNGRYEPVGASLYWIKGNNENFDTIAAGRLPEGLQFLPNAEAVTIDGVRVVGLGGTFAPSWYETPPDALPHPRKSSARATELADKRRHF